MVALGEDLRDALLAEAEPEPTGLCRRAPDWVRLSREIFNA
jgi:hypothetical protein